jgi:uncharacterized protein involved in tolerance to divalent cations
MAKISGPIVVSTTTASMEAAEAIAKVLLDQNLAACVQMMPIASRYMWQGEIVSSDEILLLIKTRLALFEAVAAAIRALHTYETPEIIATSVSAASNDYLRWLTASTGG